MAKRKSSTRQESSDYIVREIIAALLFTVGLFSALSLVFYSGRTGVDVKGAMGSIGVYISGILGMAFGVCAFVVPLVLFYTSVVVFINRAGGNLYRKTASAFLLLVSVMVLLGLLYPNTELLGFTPAGGRVGDTVATIMRDSVAGNIGSYLIVTIVLLVSLIIISGVTLSSLLGVLGSVSMFIAEKSYALSKYFVVATGEFFVYLTKSLSKPKMRAKVRPARTKGNGIIKLNGKKAGDDIALFGDDLYEEDEEEEDEAVEDDKPEIVVEQPKLKGLEDFFPKKEVIHRDYKIPPPDLLDPKMESAVEIDRDAVYQKARLIEEKLRDFGVSGKVTEIRPGPVITMFEYKPAPGIKINRIAALENDLAMGLSALSIRIIAPIPGKDVIGIEVPNAKRETVVLRELLEDVEFSKRKSMLTLALGKDISGLPFYMDLRKAPHLMIAGTTGSGKSVLLNAVITSMLYKASPYELKFIMIDPKMLELSVYEDIPHLLHPVVTEPKKAAAALRWAVEEMEKRYRILSEEGVRDIETHNKNVEKLRSEDKWDKLLPYIVIVLDELADLMMIAPNELKESITRLSQKARAAGIHLIVATQRPSADIVAGLIKANFPARISFLVSSKIDSRIILDTGGAERLLGKGDMLFLEPGTSKLLRIQGALISDEEREGITEYIKSQGKPVYNEEITYIEESEGGEDLESEKDELYYEALRTIAETGQASISMLQRKLKIGYNRAARIVEIMEKEGVVGPQEVAGKPREVFIDLSQINERRTS
ncbi:MAG TPA: DNA translocase FtsK 4TM domain-containing protein [Thermodesulfobacteriota bacterium]|nr:DNA translocase FtsK 4TM domain-containing protein [Thermodesulfobacteriota bacterium]